MKLETELETRFPIHDLFIESLDIVKASSWDSLRAYAFDDHLLKRIGILEIILATSGQSLPEVTRSEADELWILLEGQVTFNFLDQRKNSPTFNASHTLSSDRPVRVMIPFGVQFSLTAGQDAKLLRISTHAGELGAYPSTHNHLES